MRGVYPYQRVVDEVQGLQGRFAWCSGRGMYGGCLSV